MRNIRVDADVFEHLNAIARPDETAGEALQRMLAGHVIEVDDDTYARPQRLARRLGRVSRMGRR
jgi:hypothetical protein